MFRLRPSACYQGPCCEDGDGNISYAEFMPLCFNILVERFKDDVLAEAALQSSDALTQMLLEEFEAGASTRPLPS